MKQVDIENALRKAGLRDKDIVILHSSLSSIGHVEGGADAVVDAFLSVIGPQGTLVVPTFGNLGIITEIVKNRPEAKHSIHPRASVAAIGAGAGKICDAHWKAETSHGEDTPYLRIAENGGYICLLGVDQDRNTMLHSAEALLRLPYLKPTGDRTFSTPEGEVTKSWPFFPGPHRDFIGLERLFREEGKIKLFRIGRAVTRLIKAKDLLDIAVAEGGRDPAFVLCDNPGCADCVDQRADIRKDRFAAEDFRLAVSAQLAGRYVPQIVENCKRDGVSFVELDVIQGRPLEMLSGDRVRAAVEELRSEGLDISALRGRIVSKHPSALLDLAATCAVKRVVLPLSSYAATQLEAARERGVELSLYNKGLPAAEVFESLRGLTDEGFAPKLCFSPAGFAVVGEHPFLNSFRKKLGRFMDQLDVEDCLFGGASRELARGNAEIKELVSILRCSGFSGWLTLGAGNRFAGDMGATVARFVELLDSM